MATPSEAAAILSDLRGRLASAPGQEGSFLAPGLAEGFQRSAAGFEPQFRASAGVAAARVLLPERSTAPLHLEDAATGASVDVTLSGALEVAGQVADGYIIYARAHASGATLFHRALPEGAEDFLSFEERPKIPTVAYQLALGKNVSGLRLIADMLEMMDSGGAPRLRVTPPFIVGANGVRTEAALSVDGCAVDRSPVAPWGRAVRPPGATTCTVRVSWNDEGVVYPAVLDPRWTTTGSMATARQDHTATVLSTGKVLVVGGRSSPTGTTGLASAELYDRTTGTWATTASMTGGRWLHSATQLNTSSNSTTSGKVLIAGGINGSTSVSTAQLYSASAGTWVAATNLNAARHAHTATLLADGRVLAAGGMNGTATLQTAALYNPASGAGSWTATIGPIPPPGQKAHTATLLVTSNAQLNNKVLLVGGNTGTASLAMVYLFDPAQSAFSTLQNTIPTPREGHTATALSNGNILVTGGKNGSTLLATTVLFNPSVNQGSWSSAGNMTTARQAHTATLLPAGIVNNGQVLVAGGSNGSSSLSSAELWNGTSTWTATNAMLAPVQGHTASVLANGSILIAGGLNGSTTVKAAELYDGSFGISCTTNSQCASGFCVSGVCCDTVCNGACAACNLAGKVGTCSPAPSATVCRASAGTCDVAENCNGTSTTCPADGFAPSTTTCRASAGTCDVAEKCTGTSAACPADGFLASTTTCRVSAGTCDAVEKCTGTSATCPADGFLPSTTTCRPIAGACDVAESCTGTSAACPSDGFLPSTTTCRAIAGVCDVAESCTGTSAACPSDGKAANGTPCDDANLCTTADGCQSGACVGTPKPCLAADSCHDQGTCDPATGACSNPPRPCATNHPPSITSAPVTGFVLTTTTGALAPVSVRNWTPNFYPIGQQPQATWVIDSSGTVATQITNADPSTLLSDINLVNDHIEGTWLVNTANDDDFVGFVFGYQDATHFYVFDWKQADQQINGIGLAEQGMSVKVFNAPSPIVFADVWPTIGNGTRVQSLYHNRIAWADFVSYGFALDFHPGQFTITVTQGSTVLATTTINDSTYTSGRFGFYNYSQDSVQYSSFHRQTLPTHHYSYDVNATDLDGDILQYSLVQAPSGMTIDPATGLIGWDPTTSDAGPHDVIVQVRDPSGLTDVQRYTVVVDQNEPPVVNAGPDQQAFGVKFPGIVALPGSVQDELPVGDPRLQIAWSVVSGPGPVSFTNTSSPTTEALFFQAGTYVLQLSANDSLATSNDFVTVSVDSQPSLQGASFTLVASSPGPLQVGNALTLTTTLLDSTAHPMAGFPVQFGISGANAQTVTFPTDVNGVAHYTYTGVNTGTDTLQATALGSLSTLSTTAPSVSWTPAPPSGGAQVTQGWIGAPLHQSTVKGSVPITVATGVTISAGSIDYWPLNQPADVHVLAPSVSGGPGATLATLDTTLLANGPYVVRLTATNSGGTQQQSLVAVTVTGDYKAGRATLSITDFTVPLVGLPITIGRTYDSLERGKVGDFGNGWSLSIGNPRLEADPAHNVTLTEPGGRRVTFNFTATSYPFFSFLFKPRFVPDAGVFGSLTSDACDPVVASAGGIFCFLDTSPNLAITTYTYTDSYGRQFTMAATGALRAVKDLNGNQITIGANGISSSAGGVNVPFLRDGLGRITQITDLESNVWTYEYTAGDLTACVTPGGRHTYTYDGGHLLQEAKDPNGHSPARATYDPQGRLATSTDAADNVTQYAYNVATRTNTITNPDTGVVTQVFDDRGLLLTETDPLGHTTTRTYDANRLKTHETNAANETTDFTYDASGRQASRTEGPTSARRVTRTTYNNFGQLTSGTDAAGNTTNIAYDENVAPAAFSDSLGTIVTFTSSPQGLPLTVTDATGGSATFVYDSHGNKTSSTDRVGRTTTFAYDEMGRVRLTTDPRVAPTILTYTGLGKVASRQDALGNTTSFTYDGVGNLLTESRPGTTALRRYTYDPADRVASIQNFDGTTRGFTYNFRGQKLSETDELGRTTQFQYDLAGHLVKTIFPDTTFTTVAYDPVGRVSSRTDERNNATTYAYEPGCGCSERLTLVTDPLQRATQMTYDAVGRRITLTDAATHRTSYAYDARGRLTTTTYADTTTAVDAYDAAGRRTAHTDQTGAVTHYEYDAEEQLTSVTDALGNITLYEYDGAGSLSAVSDANAHRTTYAYDLLGRKTGRTLPLRQTETFGYDAVGNMTSHVDFRDKTTTYAYDLRDHQVSKAPDPSLGEPTVTFTFNPSGTRATMTDASGATSYTYDARDRVLTKAAPSGTLTYTYDLVGNVATLRSSNANGTSVDYAWDAANELASVTDNRAGGITTAAYTATGRPSLVTQPSGVAATYGYDTLDRVTSMVWKMGTNPTLASWAYTFNARGQRLTSTELSTRQAAYGYDAAARLTSETITGDPRGAVGNGALTYALDPVGNRLSRASTLAALAAQTLSLDANDQLTVDSYDPNGNTTSADGSTYAYDFANRLLSKNSGAVTIVYDGDGNRVAKTVGGITTKYLVDDVNPTGYLQVLEEVSSGAVQVRYTYGSTLVSQARGGSNSFYGYDAHGNVAFLTDATGAVTDTYEYDAWGNIVASTGTTLNTRLYEGQELDPDLGLINLRARQYKASTGRFLTLDPLMGRLLKPTSLNRYLSADADPENLWDPNGTQIAISYVGAARFGMAVLTVATAALLAKKIDDAFIGVDSWPAPDMGEKKDPCVTAVISAAAEFQQAKGIFKLGKWVKLQMVLLLCGGGHP